VVGVSPQTIHPQLRLVTTAILWHVLYLALVVSSMQLSVHTDATRVGNPQQVAPVSKKNKWSVVICTCQQQLLMHMHAPDASGHLGWEELL
jgi:hypothetical protein